MLIYPSRGQEKEEKDWEIVPSDWWRTPYNTISWVYRQDQAGAKKFHHPQYTGSVFLWPLSMRLAGRRPASPSRDRRGDPDVSLNVDLVGVKSALDPVVSYERDVGFYHKSFPDFEPRELESLIAVDLFAKVINDDDTRVHRTRWDELLANLMRTPLLEASNDSDGSSELGASCSSVGDFLGHSTSTLSSGDLTSSDGSSESIAMPSTPRAKPSLHHNVEIKAVSPTGSVTGGLHVSSSLNASASLFIPPSSAKPNLIDERARFSPIDNAPPPPSLADFTFPTLNPPVSSSSAQTVRLKKDNECFFAEDSNATTTPLLPSFLQDSSQRSGRTRKSRTREIVDRLRSESGPNEDGPHPGQKIRNTISPKYASYSPSPLNEFPPPALIVPRRSVSEDGSGEHRRSAFSSSASASASASQSASTSNSRFSTPGAEDEDDGWIDVGQSAPSSSSLNEKSKRARELLLALTRRRTDSLSSETLNDLTSIHRATQEAAEVGAEEGTNTSMSMSSVSAPSTPPPPPLKTVSAFTPPTQARHGPVISNDGWIEGPSQEISPKVRKEKVPKRDTYQRGKSMQNHHGQQHHHNPSSYWTRDSTFHAPIPLATLHPSLHQPALSLSSFHGSSPSSVYRPQIPHAHIMPNPAAHQHQHPLPIPPPPPPPLLPGTAPMPYFFPSYPVVPMAPVNMPVSPMAYSTGFNVMQVPNAYPLAPTTGTQAFGAAHPLPSGYAPLHTRPAKTQQGGPSLTAPNTAAATAVTAMTMQVPVGAGYGGGMNGNRKGW